MFQDIEHPPHIQVFYGYRLVFTNKPCRYFVQEILADIRDAFMDASNADALPVTILRLRQLAGKPPLFPCELP